MQALLNIRFVMAIKKPLQLQVILRKYNIIYMQYRSNKITRQWLMHHLKTSLCATQRLIGDCTTD